MQPTDNFSSFSVDPVEDFHENWEPLGYCWEVFTRWTMACDTWMSANGVSAPIPLGNTWARAWYDQVYSEPNKVVQMKVGFAEDWWDFADRGGVDQPEQAIKWFARGFTPHQAQVMDWHGFRSPVVATNAVRTQGFEMMETLHRWEVKFPRRVFPVPSLADRVQYVKRNERSMDMSREDKHMIIRWEEFFQNRGVQISDSTRNLSSVTSMKSIHGLKRALDMSDRTQPHHYDILERCLDVTSIHVDAVTALIPELDQERLDIMISWASPWPSQAGISINDVMDMIRHGVPREWGLARPEPKI